MFKLDNLSLRRVFSYSQTVYDDSEFIKKGDGFLNRSKELNAISFNLRTGYSYKTKMPMNIVTNSTTYNENDIRKDYAGLAKFMRNNKLKLAIMNMFEIEYLSKLKENKFSQ